MKTRRFPLVLAVLFLNSSAFSYDEVRARPATLLADKKVEPSVLKIDSDGRRWILNHPANAIQRLSDKGIADVNLAGKKGALFKNAVDFAFTIDGALVVADAGLSKIVFIEGKKTDKGLEWKGAKAASDFPALEPTAVTVSADGIVAVGSKGGVDFFSLTGVLLHHLSAPEKEALGEVTAVAFSRNGTLWALDGGKGRLHRFSAERKWLGATDELAGARGLTVDRFGFAYVTLEKGKWVEVDPAGANTGTFGAKGKAPGQLLEPVGIAADANGVMVAEEGNRRLQGFDIANNLKTAPTLPGPAAFVQVRSVGVRAGEANAYLLLANGGALVQRPKGVVERVSAQGKSAGSWKKKGKKTPGVGELSGWCVDAEGKIWVTDGSDHTIKSVSEEGEVLSTIGKKGKKEGSLKSPTHLSVRPDGSIVVADKGGSRVQVLSKDGLFLFAAGSEGKKEGQYESVGGVAANRDTIAVLDTGRKAVLFYNASGKFHSALANKEGKTADWKDPVALASDPQGRFYVLDAGWRRVRCFSAKGVFLADFAAGGKGIACGPDGRVALLEDKQQTLYDVRFAPRGSAKVSADDQDGNIKVSWDAAGEAADYRVYRSTGDGHFALLGSTATLSYVDSDITPALQYTYAVAGVGAGGHEGVWAAAAPVKGSRRKDVSLISIEGVTLRPIFTAAFKYYVGTPVGEVLVRNNDSKPYRSVKVSISLARYTDFATAVVVPSVEAGETKSVGVTLTLNEKVLELTENTPVQAEVRVSYFEDNVEKSASQNAPVTLYSRNAISWSDKARLSSFITPRDMPIADFSRAAVRAFMTELKGATIGKPMAKAILFAETVGALGVSYVPDPNTPFNVVSGKPDMLDFVQFPRETLRRRTGDCDDTTALMCGLLESIGVQTAIVDMPGHILMMANTEEADPTVLGLPEERFIFHNGTYWVPIETTQLAKGFQTAWQTAISTIRAGQEKKGVEFLAIAEAAKTYPPVTLLEADPNTPPFPEEKVKATFPAILAKLEKERYESQLARVQSEIKADPTNAWLKVELAAVQVEGGNKADARVILEGLTKDTEPKEIRSAAENNLGNLSYLAGEYKSATAYYDAAGEMAPDDGGILVNRARAAWKMGDEKKARELVADGAKSLPAWREYVGDLPAELIPKQ